MYFIRRSALFFLPQNVLKFEGNEQLVVMAHIPTPVVPTLSVIRLSVFTGYECQKGSSSRSPCRLIGRCTLMLRCTWQFTRTAECADILSRQRLRSSTTDSLSVPAVRLSTVGPRTVVVAGACRHILNDLPSDVTSSPSLQTLLRLYLSDG